jgi:tetratricopeptide (TPR) repeat protein
MNKNYFLSHSSEDSDLVKRIAGALGRNQCWLYEWDVMPGDSIFKFDRGIVDSRIFVLFWSKNAAESVIVQDEVNQARIRVYRDRGFHLVVVILDKTPLPPALAYRSYIDGTKGVRYVIGALRRLLSDLIPEETYIGSSLLRDSFQNRERELDLLEQLSFSGGSPVMILGLDGIGKTSLIKKAVLAIYSHLTPLWVNLETASTPVRLLASIARPLSIQVDTHNVARDPQQFWQSVLLPEIRDSARLFIILDDLDVPTILGYMRSETTSSLAEIICRDLVQIRKPNNPGLIVISWTQPPFHPSILSQFKSLELGPLDKKSVARALRFYLTHVSTLDYNLEKLELVAKQLVGYPGAINIVAKLIAEQGIDAILADTVELRKIRSVLAEDLFSRVTLSKEERYMLILLATAVLPLGHRQLRILLGPSTENIEGIKRKQLLDPVSHGYSLHSVLRDYVLEAIAKPADIVSSHKRLAHLFDREWESALVFSAERAEYASLCHFHALASGSRRWAKLIEKDYLEEARAAAIELYRRGQYKTALIYLEHARKMDAESAPIYDFYYALSLNRLKRSKEAKEIVDSLIQRFPRVSRYHHALGTILRFLGDRDAAIESFRKAVSLSAGRGKATALCSLAEILSEMNRSDEALPLIEEALDIEPGKSFVVATASMIYDALGQTDKALDIIIDGLRISPDNSRLHHRAGMILKKMELFADAKDHLEQASRDPALGFSVTALADVYLELDDIPEAEAVVERFPGPKQRSPSYLATKANILRRKGDYDTAEVMLKKAIRLKPDNVFLYGGMARVKLDQAQQFAERGDKQSALITIEEARNYISSGLQIEAENEPLLTLNHMIDRLESQIKP